LNNPGSNPIKFDGIKSRRLSFAWNLNRTLSKLNYRIHTDAVKARLIPPEFIHTALAACPRTLPSSAPVWCNLAGSW
jgi:hypothetical protein